MAPFGPFEPAPLLAAGVSGGPDSLALTLLLDCWARDRGGSVLALTVDHGLRPGSADEAANVGAWLKARFIRHEILAWRGDKPETAVQAGARTARYALLSERCAAEGILHLAIAHHADDQAETVLFREARNTGPAGLAGMPGERSLGPARLIRPLLAWRKQALIATCDAFGQRFIEDPSNQAPSYARSGLRRALADRPGETDRLLRVAEAASVTRTTTERDVAALLGRIALARPDGVVEIDLAGLGQASPGLSRVAVAAVLRTVGGGAYAAAPEALERLDVQLREPAFSGATLAGCLMRRWRDRLLVCREPGRIAPALPLEPGTWHCWDHRFLVRTMASGISVGPLGLRAAGQVKRVVDSALPTSAAAALPAFRRDERLLSVPGLGWTDAQAPGIEQYFVPRWPLAANPFTVVCAGLGIM